MTSAAGVPPPPELLFKLLLNYLSNFLFGHNNIQLKCTNNFVQPMAEKLIILVLGPKHKSN